MCQGFVGGESDTHRRPAGTSGPDRLVEDFEPLQVERWTLDC